MYEFIPDELKKLSHWVCWKAEPDPKAHSGISKKPINPNTGGLAASNDPNTWGDFITAVQRAPDFAGIGFMFSGSGYFGVDLDDMDLNGEVVREFVDTLQSYTELSQSKHGIHIICKGKLPEGRRRKGNIEMYDSGRFFVMTGDYCSEFVDISDGTEAVKPLHAKYLGDGKTEKERPVSKSLSASEIVEKACASRSGDRFRRLYEGNIDDYASQSEADMAFCNMLAFWCGGDIMIMDEIYRSSGLMRDKWDRRQAGSTYGRMTLEKAAKECSEGYSGTTSHTDDGYAISIGVGREMPVGELKKYYSLDDTGNAQRLNDAFGDSLRWSYVDRRWLYYLGGKWNYDNIGCHRSIADHAVALMENDRAYYSNDDDALKAFEKFLKRSRSFAGKTNMLREAEHLMPILPSMLDKDKSALNCKNGIIDLKTCTVSPHDKTRYMTKMTECAYDKNAPKPELWLRFLDDIFGGDRDLIRYVQKAVGYSVTGSTAEQCAFFMYGTGRNGKSTFLEIVRGIMGDYATNIQPQTIMINPKSGNAPSSDIARLKGARFVTSVEPNEGMRIDEGLLKQLTGDDIVTARRMFAEEFEFKPEFKLWMTTNHKPIIRGTDTGIWRRIHMIPFTVQIPESKVDKHLKFKLAKEMSGIFKWALEGCRLWQDEGLDMPKAVLDAVNEYRREMDVISSFIESCCTVGTGEVRASQLYAAYSRWAEENNEFHMSSTKFGAEMAKRYEKRKTKKGLVYVGLTLGQDGYSISVG